MSILGTILVGTDPGDVSQAKVVVQQVIAALAIRDTATYDPTSNAGVAVANCTLLGGYRLVFVVNGLNADISIQLMGTPLTTIDPVAFGPPMLVKAATTQIIDPQTWPQLMDPLGYLSVRVIAQSTPSSGSVTTYITARSC